MYLHPQMQRSLYKTIRQIGETNQVIYITHSPHFVTIPEFNEIVLVSKDNNGTHIKKSKLKADEPLKNKFRKELDPERNEMFFAKKLLIVEGDTEKMTFPEFAKRMVIDFDGVGSTIIEVGGKRNLIDFVELALSFKIPVGLVYDTDSSDFAKKDKEEEEKYNLEPEFLIEMMEVNEALADALMESDATAKEQLYARLRELDQDLFAPVKEIVENYREGSTTNEDLLRVKDYYFKKKYLLRLSGQLGRML